jgi:histidyl-tRNA synthetase
MNNTPIQTLKGFRDFLPSEKRRRDFIALKIKAVFERYGFEPIETPALEYASLLLGKYGEEADKLVYRFEDRGDREVALRYDQTVPTARVLAQYQDVLPRYFRRYQMQNVYRADKPQKGRFREFAQCDIDVFGSKSPIADAEILACTYAVFKEIGFEGISIKVNDRQLLIDSLEEYEAEFGVSVYSIIQTIDKLDKQSKEEVAEELERKGFLYERACDLFEKMAGAEVSNNLRTIINFSEKLGVPRRVLQFNPTLARGLDYYTGMIFEVTLDEGNMGSLGGGGRYDDLIDKLSGLYVPAVGVGLGFDRIVEAASELKLIPEDIYGRNILIAYGKEEKYLSKALEVAGILRQAGIATEVYPEMDEIGKQFKSANKKGVSYVVVISEDELVNNKISLKDMKTREQKLLTVEEAVELLK